MRHHAAIVLALAAGSLLVPAIASAQKDAVPNAASGRTVGIAPFSDATGSGNTTAGADVARTMLSELVHSTSLRPSLLVADGATRDGDIDPDKAIALGRARQVDRVFVGTVLTARSEESSKSGWIPAIKGQSGQVTVHRVKATVTLQGELYDVPSGRRIFSTRVTGTDANNAVGGTAYTRFGAWGNDSYRSFLDSPMGTALQRALTEMATKIADAQ